MDAQGQPVVPEPWTVMNVLTTGIYALIVAGAHLPGYPVSKACPDVFALDGEANILEEDHFGIVNGKVTIGVNYKDAASISGMWAPPYVSSDFLLELRVFGEKPASRKYRWRPFEVERSGTTRGVSISTVIALAPGTRGGILALAIENVGSERRAVPLQFTVKGTLDRVETWEFGRPESKTPARAVCRGKTLSLEQGPQAVVLRADLDGLTWDESVSLWQTTVTLGPREAKTLYVAFSMDEQAGAIAACDHIMRDPARAMARARDVYARRVTDLFERLPTLESSNKTLVDFYNRSLVHFVMNRWDVPEFVLRPYYSTGSVKGGCVCDYLWNFGETWEILPLYDPEAAREHIKQFLETDITAHFAFNPVTGEAFGPWYPVNQEKIIGLIYYYVKNAGDRAFLDEVVNGKSILDWAVRHAMYGDDPAKPVALIDYGPSNSHLELRRGYPYNHVMPDLNGRRYANYRMAARLCDVAGKPASHLRERAEALKALLKQRLWNPEAKWFYFLDDKGQKDLRYTVQMFKLFGSGVLDAEEEAGLLSHLNETEFLSAQGLHSMGKTDIAYDQVDIDNGGGGNCTSFPPQIAERLYKSGRADAAEDILQRILWWGERMPYWGDSIVANGIDYRKDTPLQCTIDGVAVAQCIIFGMFGVSAGFDGAITIDPHPPSFAPRMRLTHLRLRGAVIEVRVDGAHYRVKVDGKVFEARAGEPVVLRRGSSGGWRGVETVSETTRRF